MKFLAERLVFSTVFEMNRLWSARPRKALAVWTVNRDYISEEQMTRYEKLFDRMRSEGWTFTGQPGRNTDKLRELMLRQFSTELREYLKTHKGSTAGKMTPESILTKYREAPEKLAPYGTEYLEQSLSYEYSSDNAQAVSKIRSDMRQEHIRLTEELSYFDACIMTGPTCIMHYAGLPSLSVPFTVDSKTGIPRSIILFGTDMKTLLSVGEELERYGDKIPLPVLEKAP